MRDEEGLPRSGRGAAVLASFNQHYKIDAKVETRSSHPALSWTPLSPRLSVLVCSKQTKGSPSVPAELTTSASDPQVFRVWANILARAPGAVLWLLDWGGHAVPNLRASAYWMTLLPRSPSLARCC